MNSRSDLSKDSIREETLRTIHRMRVACGREPADVLLKNCRVINVYTGEILESDIAIAGNRIAAVRPNISLSGLQTVNCNKAYAFPGLVEPHMHIETTLISPRQLARAIIPRGTTTLFADGTDVSYVQGTKSIRALFDSAKTTSLRVYLEAPSYSAYLPHIQTTGGPIGLEEVIEMANWPDSVSLGEIVGAKVLDEDLEYIDKINVFRFYNKRLNGHTMLDGEEFLDGFVSTGITDDHTIARPDQILTRLRRGMTLFLVEAPGRRNLASYLKYIADHNLPTDRICFCIDNTTIKDIVEDDYGYLDYLVELAIRNGIAPVEAVKMASLNTARYFKMDSDIGSITPGRFADIVLVNDLNKIRPHQVYVDGRLIAENGVLLDTPDPFDYPYEYLHSICLHSKLTKESLFVSVDKYQKNATVRVLELPSHNEQAPNIESFATLPVVDGVILPDLNQDVVRLCVVERYGKNGNVGQGFCKGTGLQKGAIATSLSISDSNIVVLGCDYESMWTAISEIERIQGGMAVAEGDKVLNSYPLKLGGQMSDAPYEETLKAFKSLDGTIASLGCKLINPILTLASTVLMSVPALGLTDAGYVDAITGRVVSTIIN